MDGSPNLFKALDAEWASIGRGGQAERRCADWARREADLAPYGSPADIVMGCQLRGDPARSNQLLSALLRIAGTDPAAARAVLQALLPAVASLVRRPRVGAGTPWADQAQLDQDAVATAWERIMGLAGSPPQWPAMVIVNFTWERLRNAVDQLRCRTVPLVALTAASSVESPAEASAAEQLILMLGDAVTAGAIGKSHAGLILRTRVLGLSPADEAARSGRGAHAVYKERERAEHVLAEHVRLELAEAS